MRMITYIIVVVATFFIATDLVFAMEEEYVNTLPPAPSSNVRIHIFKSLELIPVSNTTGNVLSPSYLNLTILDQSGNIVILTIEGRNKIDIIPPLNVPNYRVRVRYKGFETEHVIDFAKLLEILTQSKERVVRLEYRFSGINPMEAIKVESLNVSQSIEITVELQDNPINIVPVNLTSKFTISKNYLNNLNSVYTSEIFLTNIYDTLNTGDVRNIFASPPKVTIEFGNASCGEMEIYIPDSTGSVYGGSFEESNVDSEVGTIEMLTIEVVSPVTSSVNIVTGKTHNTISLEISINGYTSGITLFSVYKSGTYNDYIIIWSDVPTYTLSLPSGSGEVNYGSTVNTVYKSYFNKNEIYELVSTLEAINTESVTWTVGIVVSNSTPVISVGQTSIGVNSVYTTGIMLYNIFDTGNYNSPAVTLVNQTPTVTLES